MAVTFGPKIAPAFVAASLGDNYLTAGNALLRAFQTLVQPNVISVGLTTPPGSPVNGDTYIVGVGATGLWSGHDKTVAYWTTDNPATPAGLWEFYTPQHGWSVVNRTDNSTYNYSGAAWSQAGSGSSLAQKGKRITRIFNHDGQALTAGTSHLGDYCQGLGSSAGNENAADATHGVNDTRYSFGAADTYCGWYGAPGFYRNPRNIDSLFLAFVARTTDIRFWVGLASNGGSLSVSGTPSGRYAMFRFSSIDGDTNFKACSSDGASQTVVDTGIVADTNMHRFGILFDDVTPGLKFYIDGALVATITTNLPGPGGLVYVVLANWHTSDSFPLALVGCGGISIDIDM